LLLKFIKLPLLFPFVWFAHSSLSSEKTGPLKPKSYDLLFSPMSIYNPIIGETENYEWLWPVIKKASRICPTPSGFSHLQRAFIKNGIVPVIA